MSDPKAPVQQFLGTGRRKTSVARVRLLPGTGKIQINGRAFDKYFLLETLRNLAIAPMVKTDTAAKFDAMISVSGGGPTGQAGAVRMGIARALLLIESRIAAMTFCEPRS